jgi:Protein of unknown function (DUF4089)
LEPLDPETLDAYVDAAARTLQLPIAAAHLPGVRENFARIAGLAKLVLEAPLTAADEPAPLFLPGERL